MEKLNTKGSSLIHKMGMEEEKQVCCFWGSLTFLWTDWQPFYTCIYQEEYRDRSTGQKVLLLFLIFSFFLNRKVCFSSFFYIPKDM